LAELYYELWRFTGDIKEGQMALHYYQQLMARSAHIEYRHRVEELETAVPQVTT
jgi:hypothetical protein